MSRTAKTLLASAALFLGACNTWGPSRSVAYAIPVTATEAQRLCVTEAAYRIEVQTDGCLTVDLEFGPPHDRFKAIEFHEQSEMPSDFEGVYRSSHGPADIWLRRDVGPEVAMHEFAHAFGFGHSADPASVMHPPPAPDAKFTSADLKMINEAVGCPK